MSKIYDKLGGFQTKFRKYVLDRLKMAGVDPNQFVVMEDREGKTYEYKDLKNIVLKNRDLFRDDFGAKINNLPTWLDDLREIRNKVAHYSAISPDDITLANILIDRISDLANLSKDIELKKPSRKSTSERIVSDPVSDGILQKFPKFHVKKSATEYRIYLDDGSGKGSIWIMPQKSGYALVTTGKAQRLDSEIERLTGVAGKVRFDRPYKRWTSVKKEIFEPIFNLFCQV